MTRMPTLTFSAGKKTNTSCTHTAHTRTHIYYILLYVIIIRVEYSYILYTFTIICVHIYNVHRIIYVILFTRVYT